MSAKLYNVIIAISIIELDMITISKVYRLFTTTSIHKNIFFNSMQYYQY